MTTQWCKSNPTTAYHTCVTKLLKLIFKFAATLIKFVLTISFVCSFSYSLVWTSLHMVWPFSHSSNVIFTSNESEYCYFLCEPVFSYCWQMVNFFSFIITVGIYYMPMIIYYHEVMNISPKMKTINWSFWLIIRNWKLIMCDWLMKIITYILGLYQLSLSPVLCFALDAVYV